MLRFAQHDSLHLACVTYLRNAALAAIQSDLSSCASPRLQVAHSVCRSHSAALNLINMHFLLMHRAALAVRIQENPQTLNGGDSALSALFLAAPHQFELLFGFPLPGLRRFVSGAD